MAATTPSSFSKPLKLKKYDSICGVDEVGRGALAGPVFACAVVLPKQYKNPKLTDSKQLTAHQRESLCQEIINTTPHITLSFRTAGYIDQHNILSATLDSMKDCILRLKTPIDTALIDGNKKPNIPDLTLKTIIKGDQKIPSISAASIVAKVLRDQYMTKLSTLFPLYAFDQNKGYGTKTHYGTLLKNGPSPYHRRSFNLSIQETLF